MKFSNFYHLTCGYSCLHLFLSPSVIDNVPLSMTSPPSPGCAVFVTCVPLSSHSLLGDAVLKGVPGLCDPT